MQWRTGFIFVGSWHNIGFCVCLSDIWVNGVSRPVDQIVNTLYICCTYGPTSLVNTKTLCRDTPETRHRDYTIIIYAHVLAPMHMSWHQLGARPSENTLLTSQRLLETRIHKKYFNTSYISHYSHQTHTVWKSREVGNPLVFLLPAGSFSHAYNALWVTEQAKSQGEMFRQCALIIDKM